MKRCGLDVISAGGILGALRRKRRLTSGPGEHEGLVRVPKGQKQEESQILVGRGLKKDQLPGSGSFCCNPTIPIQALPTVNAPDKQCVPMM